MTMIMLFRHPFCMATNRIKKGACLFDVTCRVCSGLANCSYENNAVETELSEVFGYLALCHTDTCIIETYCLLL